MDIFWVRFALFFAVGLVGYVGGYIARGEKVRHSAIVRKGGPRLW
jgi:hypothetical protein